MAVDRGCLQPSSVGFSVTMEVAHGSFSLSGFLADWSLFSFAANAKECAITAQPERGRATTSECALRILVVDDHCDTLRSLKLLLTRLGYQVLGAENMMDALRIAEHEQFDLLLSDIGLPDGSGHELVKRIREKRSVMAIAVSGFGMEEDVRRSRDAGFFDHLTKPVSLDRLQQVIEQVQAQSD
jgi:CheY-like chemotaxis protein